MVLSVWVVSFVTVDCAVALSISVVRLTMVLGVVVMLSVVGWLVVMGGNISLVMDWLNIIVVSVSIMVLVSVWVMLSRLPSLTLVLWCNVCVVMGVEMNLGMGVLWLVMVVRVITVMLFWHIGGLVSINIGVMGDWLMLDISTLIVNVSWLVVTLIVAGQMVVNWGMRNKGLVVSLLVAVRVMITVLVPLS